MQPQGIDAGEVIERQIKTGGSKVFITDKGLNELRNILQDLKWYLEGEQAETVVIEGTVVSGLFQGAYYISKEGYREQIQEKLGFDPFPGTLNVRIKDEDIELRRMVEKRPSIRLEGFRESERAFGACNCYPLIINDDVKGYLIVADRTIHEVSILEIISHIYLRRYLGLADGDHIKIALPPLRQSDS
jgi:riboflavin kinase